MANTTTQPTTTRPTTTLYHVEGVYHYHGNSTKVVVNTYLPPTRDPVTTAFTALVKHVKPSVHGMVELTCVNIYNPTTQLWYNL